MRVNTPIQLATHQTNSPLYQFIIIHSLPHILTHYSVQIMPTLPCQIHSLNTLHSLTFPQLPTNIRDIRFSAELSPGSTGSPASDSSYAHSPASSSAAKYSTASTFWDASQTHSPSPGPTITTHTSTHSTSCCAAHKASTPIHSDSYRDLPSACA